MKEKISVFDSFEEMFGDPSPKKKKKRKEKFIIIEEKPQEANTVASSLDKAFNNIEDNLYNPKRDAIPIQNLPPEIKTKPFSLKKSLKFLRTLRSWIASPFISKMIKELNSRLKSFEENIDQKLIELSYTSRSAPSGLIGGGGSNTIIQKIEGVEPTKYYNNSGAIITSRVLVTLSENDINDETTTIRQLLNATDEPLGLTTTDIDPDTEKEILTSGTVTVPFTTIGLPIGTKLYSGENGEITTNIGIWCIGKTVNQALNGKIYFKVERELSLNDEASFLGLPNK